MITELIRVFGFCDTADMLGVDRMTLSNWRQLKRVPPLGTRKAVWLVWSLALHPEQVQSLWDIATYGRFHGQQMIEAPEPEYYI